MRRELTEKEKDFMEKFTELYIKKDRNMNVKEIAKELEMSEATVRSRIKGIWENSRYIEQDHYHGRTTYYSLSKYYMRRMIKSGQKVKGEIKQKRIMNVRDEVMQILNPDKKMDHVSLPTKLFRIYMETEDRKSKFVVDSGGMSSIEYKLKRVQKKFAPMIETGCRIYVQLQVELRFWSHKVEFTHGDFKQDKILDRLTYL